MSFARVGPNTFGLGGRAATPGDVLAALKARVLTTYVGPQLAGRVYLNAAGHSPAGPYLVIEEAGATLKLQTSTSTIHDTRLRVKVYAGGLEASAEMAKKLENLLRNQTLDFRGGWATGLVPGDQRHQKDEALSRGGDEVWYTAVEFTTRVKR